MGINVKVRTYKSLVNILRILAVPQVLLTVVHLSQSVQFVSNHNEINQLLGYNKIRLFPSTFATLDLSIFLLSSMNFYFKGKLNNRQYLTDTENCIYGFVAAVLFLCSCGYLLFSLDVCFRDHLTADLFRQKLKTAMFTYPLGPTKPLVDLIQHKYACCGADRATDWFALDWYSRKGNFTNDDVPFSCCSNALGTPCIHLHMKRSTYYVKYNSSAPTIWTAGCVVRFSDVYLVDYEWLIYFGVAISLISMCTSILDRLVQTADNTFCSKKVFQLSLTASEPPWKKLVLLWRQREELERQALCSKNSKGRCVRSNCSIFSIISRYRKRKKSCCRKCKPTSHSKCSCSTKTRRSFPSKCRNPTVMPLMSPDESSQIRNRFSPVVSAGSRSIINEPSTTSSYCSRKRKSEDSPPSSEKRLKKLN